MKDIRVRFVCTSVVVGLACLSPAAHAQGIGQPVLGLVQGTNALVRFTTAAPATVAPPLPVTGVLGGDTLRAIDYRPATGQLYGIATNVGNTMVRTYTINPVTGAATILGTPVTFPTPAAGWDINFNPVVDRIRLVSDQDENARLHPEFGSLVADDANLTAGAAVDAAAYLNPFAGATTTTL